MFPAKSTGFHGDSTGPPRVHLTKSHWCHKLPVKGDKVLEKKHDPWSFRSIQNNLMHRPPWLKSLKTPALGVRPMQNMKDTVPSCWCHNIYELYSCIYWQLLAISWFFLDDGASNDLEKGMEGYQIILRWTKSIIKISKTCHIGKTQCFQKNTMFSYWGSQDTMFPFKTYKFAGSRFQWYMYVCVCISYNIL